MARTQEVRVWGISLTCTSLPSLPSVIRATSNNFALQNLYCSHNHREDRDCRHLRCATSPVIPSYYSFTAFYLDTGSSDLWMVSDACNTSVCHKTNMPPYPSANIEPAGGDVSLSYGDSLTGTHASGPVAQDSGTLAGLSMAQQAFAAVSDTNSTAVTQGTNGILGLGFPSERYVLC